jgi:hypothetical protein
MDIVSSVVIALSFLLAFYAVLRTIPRRRLLTFILLLLPLTVFSYRWSLYKHARVEWFVGVACAIMIFGFWWILRGRKLPPPDDSSIRVWTKDDPFE